MAEKSKLRMGAVRDGSTTLEMFGSQLDREGRLMEAHTGMFNIREVDTAMFTLVEKLDRIY